MYRFLFLVFVCTFAPLAHAATYTVTPSDNLPAAIGRLQPGDTLYLKGTFNAQLHAQMGTSWPSGTASAPITIASAPGETAVIAPSYSGDTFDMVYIAGAHYLTFDRLDFDASHVQARGGAIIRQDDTATHIRVQNSRLHDYQTSGSGGAGLGVLGGSFGEYVGNDIFGNSGYGLYLPGESNLVDSNRIHDNNGYGVHIYGSSLSCPSFRCTHDNVVRNNHIAHNGYNYAGTSGGCGIILAAGDNNQALNNVIEDNFTCGIQIYGYGTSGSKVIGNTIKANKGVCIDVNPGAVGTVLRDNACQENGGGIRDDGDGTTPSHNWIGTGAIPAGYGASGVVTGPVGRKQLPAPTKLRAQRVP